MRDRTNASSDPAPERWFFEGFTLDLAGRTLIDAGGREVSLWRSEFSLLAAFIRAPGRVLSREQLLDQVSGRRVGVYDRSIDVLIGRLRRKIEPDPKGPRLITTVPGVGYKFAARLHVAAGPVVDAAAQAQTLPEPSPMSVAERRQITVLHCAITTAGALAHALDPEDWQEVVTAFHTACSETVAKFGGAMAQSADGEAIAWFGYPMASEFDAERAVRAGIALVSAVPELPPVPLSWGIYPGLGSHDGRYWASRRIWRQPWFRGPQSIRY
jgi:DNA-binding winged helix-turn-helix (wHTH) protein